MQQLKRNKHISRFHYWSRKGYAIFCSLGREVLIGRLKKEVADCSLCKLSKTRPLIFFSSLLLECKWQKDDDDNPNIIGLLNVIPIATTSLEIGQQAKFQNRSLYPLSKASINFYDTYEYPRT